MYLCYLDESGTPEIPGTSKVFVLTGIAIPVWHWRTCEDDITRLKKRYSIGDTELHTAWILRRYLDQESIPGFESLDYLGRKQQVHQWRRQRILDLTKSGESKKLKAAKKLFKETDAYIHLCLTERRQFMLEIAECIGRWGFARLFAEAIDKVNFANQQLTPDEQAFEQIVSRFERYLRSCANYATVGESNSYGLLIHDNNQTVAKKHTDIMRRFHAKGTIWTDLNHIIETPLFVDSSLTSMVQVADVCSYAIRRYLENNEEVLFDAIYQRAHRKADGSVVGVRHFSPSGCQCKICQSRGREQPMRHYQVE